MSRDATRRMVRGETPPGDKGEVALPSVSILKIGSPVALAVGVFTKRFLFRIRVYHYEMT
jgi:hypothetical protein